MHSRRSTTCRTCTPPPSSRKRRRDGTHAAPADAVNVRRILGIDPGLRITGFGLIVCVGGKLTYVTSGCIRNTDGSLPDRIAMILRDLSSVIAAHHPTEVA